MINLIFDNLLQIHGGGHDSIGILKVLEDFLSFLELLTQQSLAENFASLLPGISSLNNLHPMVVHFPIALFTIFFLTDLFGSLLKNKLWRQCATGLLYAGTLSAILTVILGFQAAHSIEHNDAVHQIILRHQILGISVTLLAIILSIRRFFANENFLNTATYGHFSLSAILMILLIFGTVWVYSSITSEELGEIGVPGRYVLPAFVLSSMLFGYAIEQIFINIRKKNELKSRIIQGSLISILLLFVIISYSEKSLFPTTIFEVPSYVLIAIILSFSIIGHGYLLSKIINKDLLNFNIGYQGLLGILFLTMISYFTIFFIKHGYIHNIILHVIGVLSFIYFLKKKYAPPFGWLNLTHHAILQLCS